MKRNNYLLIKIFILAFLYSFSLGWIFNKKEAIMVINNQFIYKNVFNYALFGTILSLCYSLILIYDLKKKN